jgi:predicted nucleic acid-binding protein
VFVDSSAFYALIDSDDVGHPQALLSAARLTNERRRLFTTNFILAETHALVLNRIGRAVALRALLELENGPATIVRVSARDERRARAVLVRYVDKDFSLTDALSFAVMERLRIGTAFTLDDHFTQFGFSIEP